MKRTTTRRKPQLKDREIPRIKIPIIKKPKNTIDVSNYTNDSQFDIENRDRLYLKFIGEEGLLPQTTEEEQEEDFRSIVIDMNKENDTYVEPPEPIDWSKVEEEIPDFTFNEPGELELDPSVIDPYFGETDCEKYFRLLHNSTNSLDDMKTYLDFLTTNFKESVVCEADNFIDDVEEFVDGAEKEVANWFKEFLDDYGLYILIGVGGLAVVVYYSGSYVKSNIKNVKEYIPDNLNVNVL